MAAGRRVGAIAAGAAVLALAAAGMAAPVVPAGVVVVVAPAHEPESEAYADWAGYLQDFADERPPGLRLLRITPARLRRCRPGWHGSHATLFVRAGGRALLYRGMILEPDRYREGSAWIGGGGAGPPPAAGFIRTDVRRCRLAPAAQNLKRTPPR